MSFKYHKHAHRDKHLKQSRQSRRTLMIHDFSCRGQILSCKGSYLAFWYDHYLLGKFRPTYVNLMCYRLVLRDQTQDNFLEWPHHPLWLTSLLKCAVINGQHLFLFNLSVCVCPSSSPSLPPLMNSCGFVSLCGGMLGWPQLCVWAVQTRRPHLSLCMHGAHPYLRTTLRQDSAA